MTHASPGRIGGLRILYVESGFAKRPSTSGMVIVKMRQHYLVDNIGGYAETGEALRRSRIKPSASLHSSLMFEAGVDDEHLV